MLVPDRCEACSILASFDMCIHYDRRSNMLVNGKCSENEETMAPSPRNRIETNWRMAPSPRNRIETNCS
eukprot:scaffold251_cov88-Cylindrotheca_fusiformis.AAC.2